MDEKEYVYKNPVQGPINPPYKKAILKSRGQLSITSQESSSNLNEEDNDDEDEEILKRYNQKITEEGYGEVMCISNNLVEELSSELHKFIIDDNENTQND